MMQVNPQHSKTKPSKQASKQASQPASKELMDSKCRQPWESEKSASGVSLQPWQHCFNPCAHFRVQGSLYLFCTNLSRVLVLLFALCLCLSISSFSIFRTFSCLLSSLIFLSSLLSCLFFPPPLAVPDLVLSALCGLQLSSLLSLPLAYL